MTNEYFATVNYHHHEQELNRDLERRRVLAERRYQEFPHPTFRRSPRVVLAAWIGRLHVGHGHHAIQG